MVRDVGFSKMHGIGNDYIYVNTMIYPLDNPEELSVCWSALHTGIGSDGLVLIGESNKADFSMRIFNADGSEAKMCGNASRCLGKYVYDKGLTKKTRVTLETMSGIKELSLKVEEEKVTEVTVDMGKPKIGELALEFMIEGRLYRGTVVSMGNPHLVIFVEDVESIDLPNIGPWLEHHDLFPDRTNVEFAQIITPDRIRMRVWERGSGITQACGTGACATAVAAVLTGKTGRTATVVMDGGSLRIRWDAASGNVFMTGEAVNVFDGTIRL